MIQYATERDPNSIEALNQEIHDAAPTILSTPYLNVTCFNQLILQQIADFGPSNDDHTSCLDRNRHSYSGHTIYIMATDFQNHQTHASQFMKVYHFSYTTHYPHPNLV
jgi:hypothetical protein